ncbi:hypothetical protein CPB84DRAFT_1772883 [Gymnopilus junonius]|uniref:Uncharacterized protein n=1 Tax=Gymnopilus junonius TaxID=109634 RepID=A0A9P5NRX7_GYMJU|nr:hypothetical protein CPB84DRAFT_1772883 [Gymnopilus junonius]
MPKPSQRAANGQLRPHSRSSSATKLGANLQFTQKDAQPQKHTDKSKKAVYQHEAHPNKLPFARVNSAQHVHSREHVALTNKRQVAPQYPQQANKVPNGKAFRIASPSEEGDDDDEWVSSESGAATPNHRNSDSSDTASEADGPDRAILNVQIPPQPRQAQTQPHPAKSDAILTRVPTARPTDFEALQRLDHTTTAQPNPPKLAQPHPATAPPMPPSEPHVRQAPNPNNHRRSRPPSTHSSQSKSELALRPHPLIRGISHGQIGIVPKQQPLAPLTVLPSAALPQISTTPPDSEFEGASKHHHLSSSPTSLKTSSGSPLSTDLPHSSFPHDRRTSFSSTGSVNTVPVHSTIIREMPRTHDRTRTLSTMSTSSSSAALSSLTHLPTVTRPPSPQPIAFFPPVNPHANVEGIHPLLPVPYLHNHLTVLSRRTPMRESFDRVIRAKNAAAR